MAKITLNSKELGMKVPISLIIWGTYYFLHSVPPVHFLYIVWNFIVFIGYSLESVASLCMIKKNTSKSSEDIYNCIHNTIISLSYLTVGIILVTGFTPGVCACAIGIVSLFDALYLRSRSRREDDYSKTLYENNNIEIICF